MARHQGPVEASHLGRWRLYDGRIHNAVWHRRELLREAPGIVVLAGHRW